MLPNDVGDSQMLWIIRPYVKGSLTLFTLEDIFSNIFLGFLYLIFPHTLSPLPRLICAGCDSDGLEPAPFMTQVIILSQEPPQLPSFSRHLFLYTHTKLKQ